MSERNSNRIVILGGAESGTGAAVLAKKQGFEVFVSDKGAIKDKYKELLNKYEIEFEEGQHTESKIFNAGEIILSPGIPMKLPMIQQIKAAGIPIISEIEFGGRYTTGYKICITGSNGKTTTTSLLYHLLKKAGLNVGLTGNIGKSFALAVAEDNFDYFVIELSNFQLDSMYNFKAEIGILLNITPDHLDSYDYIFQRYIDSKFRITQNQTASDCFIYCSDDPIIQEELKKRKIDAQMMPFSIKTTENQTAYIENEQIVVKLLNNIFTMTIHELSLQGKHNAYNSLAAAVAANHLSIKKDCIRESLSDFQNVEHRLEPVFKVHGIQFVNDSKATNVNSTWYALECTKGPIIWIAGGIDKGNDYNDLTDLVKKRVKALICLGKDNSKLIKAFSGHVKTIVETQSMDDAVQKAYYLGKDGDTVLLSPCCASFDLFENYEHRGTMFKKAVRNL